MTLLKPTLLAALAAMLVACGGDPAPADTATDSGEPAKQTQKTAAKPPPKTKNPERLAGALTKEQFTSLTVLGLSLDMTPEQVRETLEGQDFVVPQASGYVTPLGINCIRGCDPGSKQTSAYEIKREDLSTDSDPEVVLPFFYIDSQGTQRLYQLKYTKPFSPTIHPPGLKDSLFERYGKTENVRESERRMTLIYSYPQSLPGGVTADDIMKAPNATVSVLQGKTKVKKTRLECFKSKARSHNLNEKDLKWCDYLMGLEALPTYQFFAAVTKGKSGTLTITVNPDEMEVLLNAPYLPAAERDLDREAEYQVKLDDIEARKNRSAGSIDDL